MKARWKHTARLGHRVVAPITGALAAARLGPGKSKGGICGLGMLIAHFCMAVLNRCIHSVLTGEFSQQSYKAGIAILLISQTGKLRHRETK